MELGDKDLTCAGGHDGKDLHSHNEVDLGAVIDRDKGDPGMTEKRAGCQELGFIGCVIEIPGLKSYSEGP